MFLLLPFAFNDSFFLFSVLIDRYHHDAMTLRRQVSQIKFISDQAILAESLGFGTFTLINTFPVKVLLNHVGLNC